MKKENRRQTLLCAVLIVLVAQMNFTLLDSTLKISLGAILLPLFGFILGEYAMIHTAVLAGVGVAATRMLVAWLTTGVLDPAATWPEMFFYFTYGVLCDVLFSNCKWKITKWKNLIVLAAVDYGANLMELICRGETLSQLSIQFGVLVVALLRTAVICGLWYAMQQQSLYLLKKEHAERYRRLLLEMTRLRQAVAWLRRHAEQTDETMEEADALCASLQDTAAAEAAKRLAADVRATKLENRRFLDSLSAALERDEAESEAVDFGELWQVVYDSVQQAAQRDGIALRWDIEIRTHFRTEKEYPLLTVLWGLLENALEAAQDGKAHIGFAVTREKKNICITVRDWGAPLSQDTAERMFESGFSTKAEREGALLTRGFGLALVRDVVTESLGGTVTYQGGEAKTFTVTVPAAVLAQDA